MRFFKMTPAVPHVQSDAKHHRSLRKSMPGLVTVYLRLIVNQAHCIQNLWYLLDAFVRR